MCHSIDPSIPPTYPHPDYTHKTRALIKQETDLLASVKRQQVYLGEELSSLLDEIDDVEDDRDRWKRRLR